MDNYIQGMNVLCAPLLYASRSESQAFATFHCLITQHLPAYTRAGMSGVHLGLSLIDRLLHVLDPQLSVYLTGRGLSASLYAFPSVLTLGACTPPLLEVLALWDFLLAQGPWLNLLAVVAQVVSMREVLLKDPSPNRYLRSLPPLRADQTIALVTGFLERVPEGLLREVREHAR